MRKDEKVKAFLKELSELSDRYGIYIDGCGCCDSPRLTNEKRKKDYNNYSGLTDLGYPYLDQIEKDDD